MRSHGSPVRITRLASLVGATLLWFTVLTQAALAQQTLNPTVTPVKDTGGWVYWMAEGAIVIGAIILLVAGASYLRFAPRFSHDEDDRVPRAGVRAPEPQLNLQTVWAQSSPVAVEPVPAPSLAPPQPQPAAIGAPPAAPKQAQPTAPAGQAAPAAGAQGGATAAPPRPKPEAVELDQETYDRVLAEEQAKGTSQRVAEGRARSAALKAARAKAEG
jgi:hypothetical protein